MKKIFSLILPVLIILLIFSGCSNSGEGEQIIFPIDNEPEYLDPQIADGPGSTSIVANCFEGLVTFDENSNIIPAAAESFEVSADKLVYRFHLRNNLKWKLTSTASKILGDDAETFDTSITAEDFAFGLRRAILSETRSPSSMLLMCIKNAEKFSVGEADESELGIRVTDAYTLEIELERADSNFLTTLTLPACMPCDETYFERTGGRYGLSCEYLIYNGPFYINRWNEGVAVSAKKNDAYHSADSVKPSSVYFSINNEQATRAKKVIEGTYEVSPVTDKQVSELSKVKGVTLKGFSNSVFGLMFNCNDEILQSNAVRKALSLTFDSEIMYQNGTNEKAKGIVPAACLVGINSYRSVSSDVSRSKLNKKAAKLYYEVALDKLNLKEIELTVLCSLDNEMAVRAVMQQWQSAFGVSFSVGVDAVDDNVLYERVKKGDYQLAFADIGFDSTTALNALKSFCSGNSDNVVNLSSKKYDKLIDAVKKSRTEKAHITALENAENYLVDNAIFIPLFEVETYYAFAKGVDGIIFSPTGDVLYFRNAVSR